MGCGFSKMVGSWPHKQAGEGRLIPVLSILFAVCLLTVVIILNV